MPCKNSGVCVVTDEPPGYRCQCQQRPKLMTVREQDCAENVAFKKNASQSSNYDNFRLAGNAVDGSMGSHSSTSKAGWWMVDFDSLKVIDKITMKFHSYLIAGGSHVSNFMILVESIQIDYA